LSILACSTLGTLVLSRDCSCVRAGEDEGENLDKRDEDSTADVGEEEGEDVSSQPPAKHRHAAVHVDRSLRMEILEY